MNATEVLRAGEAGALEKKYAAAEEAEIISHVTGKTGGGNKRKKLGAITAGGFLTAIIILLLAVFSSGNYIISAISERLIEETDVQYADAVESKMLVFQQALANGELPSNTVERLKINGVIVGNSTADGFIENARGTELKIAESAEADGEVVSAGAFIVAVHNNVKLYDAFTAATYGRAAYYYDEVATDVIKKIGTNRNNYTRDSDFDAVMDSLLGEGSSVNVNGVALFEREDEDGNKYYEYDTVGTDASSSSKVASSWVSQVISKNTASDLTTAALQTAETINVADTLSKEQRSALYYLSFMENISKTKAGDGNDAKINEAMNYLFDERETTAVDVATGQLIKTTGTMLEAPSLYAVLSGDSFNALEVENYASDRALKVVENNVQASAGSGIKNGTVTSTTQKTRGSIGRFLTAFIPASYTSVAGTVPMVEESLMENSFETIGGIYGGEFLVEGAVNVGKELAKASGAAAGDASAARSYARLNNTILALDAEVERANLSPFDISSRNTFLGSIVYNFAVMSLDSSSLLSSLTTVGRVMGSSIGSLLPATYADNGGEGYLTNYGNCKTLASIGAVGTASCAMEATFDVSTLNDTFNDPEFIAFVNENTTLDANGERKVIPKSVLADYILYNDERITPMGFMDGGILSSVISRSSSIPFLSNILAMIKIWLGAKPEELAVATGQVFVNSASNPNWQTYKYAQRYVSLARATSTLRQYAGEATYERIYGFEGSQNPVVAFLNDYYSGVVASAE